MINGETGGFSVDTFVGVIIYYQRLHHLVRQTPCPKSRKGTDSDEAANRGPC